jgi:hypothetical protein
MIQRLLQCPFLWVEGYTNCGHMWERRSDKDHCRQDMSVPPSCTFRPSCDLFVSSFLYFHVACFLL